MAINMKRAKRIQKRCIAVGKYECALEEGVSVETIDRYLRLAEGEKYGKSPLFEEMQRASARMEAMREEAMEWCAPENNTPHDTRPVLIVPDLHAPYHHPDTIEFLKWVQEFRGCRERVVSVGDMWDFHSMSFHKNEPDAMSPDEEYEAIKDFSAEFSSAFPEGDIVYGNHCSIPKRKMVDCGLTPALLKNPNEMFEMPDGWVFHDLYYVIEPDTWDVLVEHGCGSGGKYGCANTSKEKRCSYVQGHTHSSGAVIQSQNHKDMTFGMNVGALVDSRSLAMRYGKYSTRKATLGCGVVYSGSHAEFIPLSTWGTQLARLHLVAVLCIAEAMQSSSPFLHGRQCDENVLYKR